MIPKTSLSKIGDGNKFCRSLKTKTVYTVIKKIKGGYVIQSEDSDESFIEPGKTKVYKLEDVQKDLSDE